MTVGDGRWFLPEGWLEGEPLCTTGMTTGLVFALGTNLVGASGMLSGMARIGRRVSKDEEATFPAWQGMQYFASMFSGEAQLHHVNNDRYGPQAWTSVRDVLKAHVMDGATRR